LLYQLLLEKIKKEFDKTRVQVVEQHQQKTWKEVEEGLESSQLTPFLPVVK
jgi:hypothetical protein